MLSAGFFLKATEATERVAWRELLRSMLEKEGFKSVKFE